MHAHDHAAPSVPSPPRLAFGDAAASVFPAGRPARGDAPGGPLLHRAPSCCGAEHKIAPAPMMPAAALVASASSASSPNQTTGEFESFPVVVVEDDEPAEFDAQQPGLELPAVVIRLQLDDEDEIPEGAQVEGRQALTPG